MKKTLPLIALMGVLPINFISFGDWGSGSDTQRAVANAAKSYCEHEGCSFVVTLGDNFYPKGVSSTKDPKWKTYYKDIYGPLNLPFYAVVGNHDEYGNVQAQIDYSKIDSTWHLPGKYYSAAFPEGADQPVIEFFIINNGDRQFKDDQKIWLEHALAISKASWKVLTMHMPIISNGRHGDDNAGINDQLIPVVCGKVDLYLSGHDHSFARMKGKWKDCPVEQLVIGTGGDSTYAVNAKDPRVKATGSFFGFGWFSATPDQLKFRMIKSDGSLADEFTWKKNLGKH